MSMDALNTRDDSVRTLRIWLLSAVTMEGGTTHYRLAGRFQANGQTWEVLRRYSEFLALRAKLIKFFESAEDDGDACPGCVNYLFSIKRFEFPKKHLFSSRNPAVVNYRVKALRSFMNLLASWAFSNAPKCPLCGGHAFELVRNFVIDGAEPVTGSDMDYIRGSITIDAFANHNERPSAFERRHSWIPASGSATLKAQQEQHQQQTTPKQPKSTMNAGGPKAPDAYDTFNDYLPARPSSQRQRVAEGTASKKFSSQSQKGEQQQKTDGKQPYQRESFLLYTDAGMSFDSESVDAIPTTAQESKESKLRKHKSEPRNVARAPDDSFVSFSSVNVQSTVTKGSDDDDEGSSSSPHSNMLSSPNVLPNKKKPLLAMSPAVAEDNDKFFDSFISEDIVSFSADPAPSTDDDDDRRFGSSSPSDEEAKSYEEEEDDGEIELTGVALASPPQALKSAKSGENLWQPWELARVQ
ncbi:hypothetical protein Gpo141_00005476 [Globisporangium polare]